MDKKSFECKHVIEVKSKNVFFFILLFGYNSYYFFATDFYLLFTKSLNQQKSATFSKINFVKRYRIAMCSIFLYIDV